MRLTGTPQENNLPRLKVSFIAVATTVALAGCVVAPDNEKKEDENETLPPEEGALDGQESKPEFIATSYTTSTELGVDLELNVRPLELLENEAIKLSMEVSNNSDRGYVLADALSDPENLYSASNTTLIDPYSQTRHLNNELEDGSCYCTSAEGTIASGDSVDLEVIFPAPPEGTETMTVTTPVTAPFFDIPIKKSTESADEEYSEGKIIPLTMISDGEDGAGWSEQENKEELSILLSSDVLFAFESSELTSDADEIIDQVASEIDHSSSDTVKVEGHTDSQGTDAINVPLSEERANSVESALSEQIARDDIKFETVGHGSSNPVADNDTEEGQELNRRVTVTFAK